METGDFALSALPDGAVVERKTAEDLVGCMTGDRARFERELARSRYVGCFVVVVESGMEDVLRAARGMSEASVIGTLAAWQRRYTGFFFAGNIRVAAAFAFRFLGGQVREIGRNASALEKVNMRNTKGDVVGVVTTTSGVKIRKGEQSGADNSVTIGEVGFIGGDRRREGAI
jgi:hypothetical protein